MRTSVAPVDRFLGWGHQNVPRKDANNLDSTEPIASRRCELMDPPAPILLHWSCTAVNLTLVHDWYRLNLPRRSEKIVQGVRSNRPPTC